MTVTALKYFGLFVSLIGTERTTLKVGVVLSQNYGSQVYDRIANFVCLMTNV